MEINLWGSLMETAADICPWNYSQSITMSNETPSDWTTGMRDLLWDASNMGNGYTGGIIILRNNDVRGVDLYRCRQNYNPRLLNCWPITSSTPSGQTEKMWGLAPQQLTPGTVIPVDDPEVGKPFAEFQSFYFPPAANPIFSLDEQNSVQTSESFSYPSVGYGWSIKGTYPNSNFSNNDYNMTIEFLFKPAKNSRGPQIKLPATPTAGGGGMNPDSWTSINGNWMPVITKNGEFGEYGVYVDTYLSNSIGFGFSYNNSPFLNRIWFTTPMNTIIPDPDYGNPEWTHCTVVRDFGVDANNLDQGLKWYINGRPAQTGSWYIAGIDPSQDFITGSTFPQIANDSGSRRHLQYNILNYFSGSIGFVRTYNRAMNQYQALTNFYKSGIWCDYDGYDQELTYEYPYNGTTETVYYTLNGGVNCNLELFIDHGNLVSDNGLTNTNSSSIHNIREYSASFDGYWSGSVYDGLKWSNDMKISQSSDAYQTYDSENGARFYPGTDPNKTDPRFDQYAYEHADNVFCNTDVDEFNTLEMWIRLSSTTGSNGSPGSGGEADRVVFCADTLQKGRANDFGLMYNEDGFGFWDGTVHYGIPWTYSREYLRDRWCYVQAVFKNGTWNDTDKGEGFMICLNGDCWNSGSFTMNPSETLTTLQSPSSATWENMGFAPTQSLNFMGNWRGNQKNGASGSIAEIRWYSQHLKYTGSVSYAFGPDYNPYLIPPLQTSSLDEVADTPYDWVTHNWNANKVRFGMGGDKSFT